MLSSKSVEQEFHPLNSHIPDPNTLIEWNQINCFILPVIYCSCLSLFMLFYGLYIAFLLFISFVIMLEIIFYATFLLYRLIYILYTQPITQFRDLVFRMPVDLLQWKILSSVTIIAILLEHTFCSFIVSYHLQGEHRTAKA